MLSKYCVAFIHHKNFRSSCHQMVVLWSMTWFCLYITIFINRISCKEQIYCCEYDNLFVVSYLLAISRTLLYQRLNRGNIFWVSNLKLWCMESCSNMQTSSKGIRCHAWYSLYIYMCIFHFLLLLIGYKDVDYNFFL